MGQDKEQLNKLLDFIDSLAKTKGNEWFVEELRKRYGKNNNTVLKINNIERYLGLDFKIDTFPSIIDYSFIKDPMVFEQLTSDNREMLRYRYGVRSHTVDFYEFCRFAHLQAEMLLNYYYSINCRNDFLKAKQTILKFNPSAKISDDYPEIESIAYSYKLKAFISEKYPSLTPKKWFSNQGQFVYETLMNVKEIRNNQSHRGKVEEAESFIHQFEQYVKDSKLPWNDSKKDFDWGILNNNQDFKHLFDIEFSKKYQKFKWYLWIIHEPYEDVIRAIKKIIIFL